MTASSECVLLPGGKDRLIAHLIAMKVMPTGMAVVMLLIAAIVPAICAWYEGNYKNSTLTLDFYHDVGYWDSFILGMPVSLVLLPLYFGRLPEAIKELKKNDILQGSQSQWKKFYGDANSIYESWYCTYLPWGVGLVVTVAVTVEFVFGGANTWHAPSTAPNPTWAAWTHIPLIFVFYYLISCVVLRLIATYKVLRRLFQMEANVQSLHPDGCGGLASLGALSRRLNIGGFVFGVIVVTGVISNVTMHGLPWTHSFNIALVIAYALGASITFFLPLHAAHSKMKDAKHNELGRINRRFQALNRTLMRQLDSNDEPDYELIAQLGRLRDLHDMSARMPIYPFDAKTVGSFIVSILLPIIVAVLQEIVKKFM